MTQNLEAKRARKRAWYARHRERERAKAQLKRQNWSDTHRLELRLKGKERRRNQRLAVLDLLGGKCVRCGFSDPRALQVDHINGGGTKELVTKGDHYIAAKILRGETAEYQLLCANCNWIKLHENGENPSW